MAEALLCPPQQPLKGWCKYPSPQQVLLAPPNPHSACPCCLLHPPLVKPRLIPIGQTETDQTLAVWPTRWFSSPPCPALHTRHPGALLLLMVGFTQPNAHNTPEPLISLLCGCISSLRNIVLHARIHMHAEDQTLAVKRSTCEPPAPAASRGAETALWPDPQGTREKAVGSSSTQGGLCSNTPCHARQAAQDDDNQSASAQTDQQREGRTHTACKSNNMHADLLPGCLPVNTHKHASPHQPRALPTHHQTTAESAMGALHHTVWSAEEQPATTRSVYPYLLMCHMTKPDACLLHHTNTCLRTASTPHLTRDALVFMLFL